MASIIIGTGNDELVLQISQDAWQGDAQYSITVDGVAYGDMLTASSLHASGESDTVTVHGDWGAGPHTVSLALLNDGWGGTPDTDRNLYLDGAVFNGLPVLDENSVAAIKTSDPVSFDFVERGPYLPTYPPTTTTIGEGSDTLALKVSQDAYLGVSAQYAITVDGVQIGGPLTASALHVGGQSDTVLVKGDWGAGPHAVTVTLLNDEWGGTPDADRNLYLDGATFNGLAVTDTNSVAAIKSSDPVSFDFVERGPILPVFEPTSTTIGSGNDALVLKISQDAVQPAYAQYTVSVDGVQIGGVLNAGALHSSGQSDTVTVLGDWGAGSHLVSVAFLNDFYAPESGLDRNLYLDGATFNGLTVNDPNSVAAIKSSDPASFDFVERGPYLPTSPPDTSPEPPPVDQPASEPVDWNALAAQALANYEATGQWFI
ncbi:hypothetical protein JMJ55_26310 [Belnapia sp. T6]|uniref:Carbohydrate binding module xylan-binding domain-containing protein n=1 Tax=Belnapia mucosa TaxID=2804532 RepID=A0ABS1VB06_9PROT|nr:carbohydrate-binding domain-containing protein [Belnapia mucosa]MBL6458850.1 hypothetical protein [Belnapia mucosa]